MASTDPWITLGRTAEQCRSVLEPPKEIRIAVEDDGTPLGLIAIDMRGLVRGYIQTVVVAAHARGRGVGTALIAAAEQEIFCESPNAFICVSSFNQEARRLYERLGYALVGALTDFVVAGHDELLLRKTRGPWQLFTPAP
ncbi:MAG: GNAT family N-acetyltransferase [Gemmatimonadaceae bacterium]|nr:GNAT family N-acetyltransferase [Gemmatimonadaceae bacterium]